MSAQDEEERVLVFKPLTSERWTDFEALFGPQGGYGGCWCMWWRLTRSTFKQQQGDGARRSMKALVEAGEVPGILAYANGKAVGWCSIAPRENYGALERSPVLKRLDDQPVWSIVCFFVTKEHRGQGVAEGILGGAVAYAREQGAKLLEAYPKATTTEQRDPAASYMGLVEMFERAGFTKAASPTEKRTIMRYAL